MSPRIRCGCISSLFSFAILMLFVRSTFSVFFWSGKEKMWQLPFYFKKRIAGNVSNVYKKVINQRHYFSKCDNLKEEYYLRIYFMTYRVISITYIHWTISKLLRHVWLQIHNSIFSVLLILNHWNLKQFSEWDGEKRNIVKGAIWIRIWRGVNILHLFPLKIFVKGRHIATI